MSPRVVHGSFKGGHLLYFPLQFLQLIGQPFFIPIKDVLHVFTNRFSVFSYTIYIKVKPSCSPDKEIPWVYDQFILNAEATFGFDQFKVDIFLFHLSEQVHNGIHLPAVIADQVKGGMFIKP